MISIMNYFFLAPQLDRRHNLEDSMHLFTFYRECDDFDSWMMDKEKMLTVNDPDESVEVMKRKFENFITDLSASSRRLEDIDLEVGCFAESGHSQMNAILAVQKRVHERWNNLNYLKSEKEKSLEGATSVEVFNSTCDDASDWMLEKMKKLDIDDLGRDMKTVQSLQLKHQNVERELAPVEEKFNRVNLLAESVKNSYPHERLNITARQKELQEVWNKVKEKATERKSRLDDSLGLQIFNNSAKNLLAWVSEVKQILNSDEPARDVATAEHLLKIHGDLEDDIWAHQDEFKAVQDLGSKLHAAAPNNEELKEKVVQLHQEQDAIHRGWQEKGDWLRQCMDLQLFNREADQIDSISHNHNTFLEFEDLGGTLDDVEGLLKRHEDFENTFIVQDERLKSFYEMADKLIQAKHYDSQYVDDRRKQVLGRREEIQNKAVVRKEMLLASLAYQEFKADADEFSSWIKDKLKIAKDESYRDLSNLERKLKKHEAFEAELKANEDRLNSMNRAGKTLLDKDHYSSPKIQELMMNVCNDWNELCKHSNDRDDKLRQAVAQHTYNRTLEDAKIRLDDMESKLASDDTGNDLRSVKTLMKNHQNLEKDLATWDKKIDEMVTLGEDMATKGHFDAPNILNASKAFSDRFSTLKAPADERKHQLQESFKFHSFNFEVDTEMQWIHEHLLVASSTVLGQNLIDAQNYYKKHQKLELEVQGHQSMIDKTLAHGQALIDDKHISYDAIEKVCDELKIAWEELLKHVQIRKKILELSLRAQQFLAEANEVELWMNEKNDILNSTDYGRDEDAVIKLLTKQKALELEIDTYDGLVTEMATQAQQMIDNNHPDTKIIGSKQKFITQQMKNLQKLANIRRKKLMESNHRHEFFRETADLEEWIGEQMQFASSEDFGQDYEHLLLLQKKFDDFKHQVETSSERFTQCEELCKKLLAADTPYSGEILSKEESLRVAWASLLDHIEARDQKLQAAGEIHRFNRDVADALQRIQEKYAGISDDLGKDLNSVLSLIRKHEGFENDLVALEAQVILIDDSARLQAAYPGGNADHILEQQNIVVENWNTLQERAGQRKMELQLACDLQRFFASVRDLENWSTGLRASMTTEEKVRDMASAQILKTEHEHLKAEIEAREESFKVVVQAGELMIQDDHYAQKEIRAKLDHLLEERGVLHSAWQHKKVYLDQLIDLQFFMRDAKQLDSISTTQEIDSEIPPNLLILPLNFQANLSSSDYGATVDEVDVHVKKHDAFGKLMCSQDEKLSALQVHGKKLLEQNHFDKDNINVRLEQVFTKYDNLFITNTIILYQQNKIIINLCTSNMIHHVLLYLFFFIYRRSKIKDLSCAKKVKLSNALLYAQFIRDVAEAKSWIEDKKKHLDAENLKGEVTSLEDKIKILQKHQAFQSELSAHEGNIINIKEKGELLLEKQHEESPEIRSQLKRLLDQWNSLLQEVMNRGRGLEEAQDILEFNNQVEKVEAWIRDKDMMVQAGDMGRDYEHCLALQRKLDDVDSDMRVDDTRMKNVNGLADKLIRQGRSDTRTVQQRREELNQKWRALQGALNEYREHLGGALEIHAFNRDVDDTNDRINEKATALSVDDYGKDLAGVEALQRKQDAVEREMTAIEGKLKEHDIESRKLIQKYPDMSSPIRNKLSDVQDNWRQLNNLRQKLSSAYTFQKFMSDRVELEAWVNDMISKMTIGELANNAAEAENMLLLHQERKAEIDGRQETFKSLKEFGRKHIQQKHYAMDAIEESIVLLEELRRVLVQTWEEKKQLLTQCRNLQTFKEVCEKADTWLQNKEAFLNNEDLGESMSSVEALIRKHVGFEKTMLAQEEKIDALEKFSTELVASKHYDSAAIQRRCQAICQRRDRLKESSMVRKKMLLESKQLQQFLRNIYEVVSWIHEKIKVACDESYRDPTNLQSKIQKHQAFEAELTANKGRVNNVNSEGEQLIGAGHFASMEIQTQLNELEQLWRQLLDETSFRQTRLQDAYQALVFSRTLDDLDAWMDEIENHLQSEDHGKDLKSVQNLLKKQLNLEIDVNNHAENITQVKDTAASFQNSDHFMNSEIQERATQVIERYSSLHEPLQIRRENLEDSLLLHQYYRDVEDEMSWITEKEPLASSEELGSSLFSVQNLQKKHQALVAEIQSHEPFVGMVTSRAHQMIKSNHFASSEVENRLHQLHSKFQQLKDQSSVRRLRLLDAEESHMFYSEINEAEAWIKEKLPLVVTSDGGKDEDSVLALIKKLDGLLRDIENFNNTINKLANLSQSLIERGHFDSQNIKIKQVTSISFVSHNILKTFKIIKKQLMDSISMSRKLHKFLWECDELCEWIADQIAIADSDDFGKDVEHVEMLIQKFESFINGLHSCETRVEAIKTSAASMMQETHPECEEIRRKCRETEATWEELKEATHNRQEALAGAKQVHVFDRNADETIDWIQEKETVLSSEDYGHDLESIQIMIRKHDGFERDLAAVKKQVDCVIEEAEQLASIFPGSRDHISVKHGDTVAAWNQLLDNSARRSEKLNQAEQLQSYFDEYRELLAWINEMMAIMTSDELARDVEGAEALVNKHKEHKAEISTRTDAVAKFTECGRSLIDEGHFMADEIEDKIKRLDTSFQSLLSTWEKRKSLYDQNLDTQIFLRDAEQLESWIKSRQSVLENPHLGDSILAVEELIRKHEDFEKTIDAQAENFSALQRTTMLEEAFRNQQIAEEKNKKVEAQQREHDRLDTMKRKEQQRILSERRREDDRRKTQEIVFKKPDEDHPINGEQIEINAVQLSNEYNSSGTQNYPESNEISHFMKRGESLRLEKKVNRGSVKRAESMKPKRTPSFTTRKKSMRRKKMEDLPPVEIEGFLDRKQELQSGGKKATIRSWKGYYTVLCGQLLCFFKDKNAWIDNVAAAPPLNLHQGQCTKATNYTKKKHVFRLQLSDGSEYLFTASSNAEMEEWMKKLSFHAALHPSKQLMSYDIYKDSTTSLPDSPPDISTRRIISSSSSPTSSPEMNRTLPPDPALQNQRLPQSTDSRVSVKSRIELFQNQLPPPNPDPRYQDQQQMTFHTFNSEGQDGHRQNGDSQEGLYHMKRTPSINEDAPPLPASMPPPATYPIYSGTESGDEDWSYRNDHHPHMHGNHNSPDVLDRPPHNADDSRYLSLPQNTAPPVSYDPNQTRSYSTMDHRSRMVSSEGSSESELSSLGGVDHKKGSRDSKKRGFSHYFRKKKGTHL
ncbi:Spectrin beta chain, non-erythrocytic 5 [Nymphon striatum]|nr:Spectrin beta chain, non-erythrocytic 5 [Nymphon striatum]